VSDKTAFPETGTGQLPQHDLPRNDLAATLAIAWQMLARGVVDRRSPLHTPMIATTGLDGRPRLRAVVLRGVDAISRTLRFHTDARSDKIAELAADPRIALTGYDAAARVQIRGEGTATVHACDTTADLAWEGSRPFSRVCYGVEPGPGALIETGGAFRLPSLAEEIAQGREHFRAVILRVDSLEWLHLGHEGHRRAHFELGAGEPVARWLVP
jgi:pyridoxamine 5'-phosphate oxidase